MKYVIFNLIIIYHNTDSHTENRDSYESIYIIYHKINPLIRVLYIAFSLQHVESMGFMSLFNIVLFHSNSDQEHCDCNTPNTP